MKSVYILFLYLVGMKCDTESSVPTSGPFHVSLVRVSKCEKTTYPRDPDPSIINTVETLNSSTKILMRGNVTVVRAQKFIQLKLKSFTWQHGKWKMTYLMNNIGCHGLLLHLFLSSVGVKYDRETCSFVKGQYLFNNIDIDPIQHIWTSKMEYGRLLWTSEVTSRTTTIDCTEFETLVEPLDSS